MDTPVSPPVLERATLAPVVSRALGVEQTEVVDWTCASIHAAYNPMTGGVFRVSGTATVQGESVPWSAVLKISRAQERWTEFKDDQLSPLYSMREFRAYQSGLLADLPGALKAPRCLLAEEHSDRENWLWLEDVRDEQPGKWPYERRVLAARHVGQLGGAYLTARLLPDYPWLSRGLLRAIAGYYGPRLGLYPSVRDHPLVRRWWPGNIPDRVLRLRDDSDALLDALDRLPQTFCHFDAFRGNFMARDRAGVEETVAVDWAFVGIGAVGSDLLALLGGSVWDFELDPGEVRDLVEPVFAAYVEGLGEAGWRGNEQLARLGYLAGSALRWGLTPYPLMATQEEWRKSESAVYQRMGRSLEEVIDRQSEVLPIWLDLADEARELLPLVRLA